MDICQHCIYCSKLYSNIGDYISHLSHDNEERILYVSAKQLSDDGFVIKCITILLKLVKDPHRDPVLHPSDADPSITESKSETGCVNQE